VTIFKFNYLFLEIIDFHNLLMWGAIVLGLCTESVLVIYDE
jgi:hypothetical protein